MLTQRIVTELQKMDIEPIVKDESESARLAGFAANIDGDREIHVHTSEVDRAQAVVERILKED